MPGKLSATYDLRITDFGVRDSGPFTKNIPGRHRATATLDPSANGLILTIEIETDNPEEGLFAADTYAKRLADHLTLYFCDHVKEAIGAAPIKQTFQGADGNTRHLFPAEIELSGLQPTVRVTRHYSGDDIATALADFMLRLAAPTPAFANDIIIARRMYIAALNVENAVARFLIIYSALAAFAAFKLGTKGGTQARVEKILTVEDPTIQIIPPPPQAPFKVLETEFTSARNDFIHAEDRGRQPAAAAAAIEGLTPRFQAVVGRILLKG